MREVDLVSDLLINMAVGLVGKSQPKIDKYYEDNDLEWPGGEQFAHRFRYTMDTLDRLVGAGFRASAWRSEVNFFTLFATIYDLQWELGSPPDVRKARRLAPATAQRLGEASEALKSENVPKKVLDAMQRASSDLGRRRTRFEFLRNVVEAS
jgi:hypothetical protein